jgi:hypothetical protein
MIAKTVAKAKAYPLEDDIDLLHVCWSYRSPDHLGGNGFISHIVHKNGLKTLCGRKLYEGWTWNRKPWWNYEIWSRKDDVRGVETVGCKLCRRSSLLVELGEPVFP